MLKLCGLYTAVITIVCGGLCAPRTADADDANRTEQLISFRIEDQFDRLHTDRRYRGSAVLVSWADRKGSDYLDDWNGALGDSLAAEVRVYRVRLLNVAHVKGAPFFVKGKIKSALRRDHAQPVLMDWGGKFAEAYACTPDHCNLLIFDRSGQLVANYAVTTADSSVITDVVATVRALAR